MIPETAKWLTLLGITCQFVSFFFVTPQLLGSKGISTYRGGVRKAVRILLWVLGFLIPVCVVISLIAFTGYLIFQIPFLREYTQDVMQETLDQGRGWSYRLRFIFLLFLIPLLVLLYPVIKFYLYMVGYIHGWAEKIVDQLENNRRARGAMLWTGAFILFVGTTLQLLGEIYGK